MNKKFVKSIRFTEIGAPSPCARPTRRANNNNSPIREEQRQQPHFAQPTSVLLFLPLCRKKKLVKLNFANFFCNSCRAAKVPRPTTLLGARFVIKVSFITIIINIFMLIHHYTTKIY